MWQTARQTSPRALISKSCQEFWGLVGDSHEDPIALDPEIFPLVSPYLEFAGDCGVRSKCLPGAQKLFLYEILTPKIEKPFFFPFWFLTAENYNIGGGKSELNCYVS